ncbi:hypothetical protein C5Y96_25295 [Blastopirellula marina]|uniref:Uncharacterized protein n=1 Tax=Blastopirellula marina TaxID=124 RepID=A0A2S8EZY7_9BACT|nr:MULTISPECIES: hypothetical protein [Pirellulaceae]PQO25224.1 hypothetical protein C5Y96_25295 [Blastopirellula marina]RCS41657.1 hypothetical protein DTL36_25345 [Bremerella cremea]
MNDFAQDPNQLRLSRFGLSCFMAVVVLMPISMLIFLWVSLPKKSDNPLPIAIRVAEVDSEMALIVKNESDKPLASIGITLNDAFHYYSKDDLPGGQEMTIALGAFTRKNGLRFDPESHQLTEIGVYAKLDDKSRGVWDRHSDELLKELQASSEAPAESETTEN